MAEAYEDFIDGNKRYKSYLDFAGGQNDTAPPDNLTDSEAEKLVNVNIIPRGGIETRSGTEKLANWFTTATTKIQALIEFRKTNGDLKRLALINNNLIEQTTNTVLKSNFGDSVDWAQWQEKLYLIGGGEYYEYDGTTLTVVTNIEPDSLLTSIKRCKYIAKRGNTMFAAGDPDNPNILYYSQVGDPTYFKSGSAQVKTISDDGEIISGISEYHEAILVWKPRSVYAWFGTILADAEFRRLNVSTGTKAHRTIQEVGNHVFFLGEDGVYALLGTYKDVIVSRKISNNVDTRFKTLQHADDYYKNYPCAVFKDGKYMLSFSDDPLTPGENNVMAVFHHDVWVHVGGIEGTRNEPWTFYEDLNISEFLYSLDGNLYMGGSTNTDITSFNEELSEDQGVAISYEIVSKDYNLGAPIHVKKIKRAWMILRQFDDANTIIDTEYHVDYEKVEILETRTDDSLIYDNGFYGIDKFGWIDTLTRPFRVNKKGKRIQVKITGSTIGSKILLYGFAFEYKLKKPSKS